MRKQRICASHKGASVEVLSCSGEYRTFKGTIKNVRNGYATITYRLERLATEEPYQTSIPVDSDRILTISFE